MVPPVPLSVPLFEKSPAMFRAPLLMVSTPPELSVTLPLTFIVPPLIVSPVPVLLSVTEARLAVPIEKLGLFVVTGMTTASPDWGATLAQLVQFVAVAQVVLVVPVQ